MQHPLTLVRWSFKIGGFKIVSQRGLTTSRRWQGNVIWEVYSLLRSWQDFQANYFHRKIIVKKTETLSAKVSFGRFESFPVNESAVLTYSLLALSKAEFTQQRSAQQ